MFIESCKPVISTFLHLLHDFFCFFFFLLLIWLCLLHILILVLVSIILHFFSDTFFILYLWPIWNSLCRPDYPQTHRKLPAFVSLILGLKEWILTLQFLFTVSENKLHLALLGLTMEICIWGFKKNSRSASNCSFLWGWLSDSSFCSWTRLFSP